jgi:hypothetical protein
MIRKTEPNPNKNKQYAIILLGILGRSIFELKSSFTNDKSSF